MHFFIHVCLLAMQRLQLLLGSYQWPTHPRCWSWPGECEGWGQTGNGTDEGWAGAGMEPAAPQPWLRSCGTQKLLPEKRGEAVGRVKQTDWWKIGTCEGLTRERGIRIPYGNSTWHDDWPGSWTCRQDLVGSNHLPVSRAPCMWSCRGCQGSSMQ